MGLTFLVLSLICSGSGQGQSPPPPPPSTPSRPLPIPQGNVDITRSVVYVFVGKTGLGHEHAVSGKLAGGQVTLGSANGGGELVFDMRSFRADGVTAREYLKLDGETPVGTQQQVNQNMLGSKVLHAAKFPIARFVIQSTACVPASPTDGAATHLLVGDFSLHGVTRRVSIPVVAKANDGGTHLSGQFSILQSDYGIKPFRKALGAIGVADEVTIHGDFWIKEGK